MAIPTRSLIVALRQTADRLDTGCRYQWTHQGACNCGHLVQTVTHYTPAQIHAMALEKSGDWAEKAQEYCPGSRYPIDHIIATLLNLGLTREDIVHLERLSDPAVLRQWPREKADPVHNQRDDVALYLRLWASLLEASLPPQSNLSKQPAARGPSEKVSNEPVLVRVFK